MKAKRKSNIWLWVLACIPCLLVSCDHNVHDGEGDGSLSISLDWADEADEGTEVKDVKTWIMNAEDGTLVEQSQHNSAHEMASERYDLPEGHYRILTTTNLVPPFTLSEQTRAVTDMNNLVIGLSDQNASPEHAYYGVTDIVIDNENVHYITKSDMRRVLAELTINIKGAPQQTKITGKVLNVATGLVALQQNEDGTFGTPTRTKEECDIPAGITILDNMFATTKPILLMPTCDGVQYTNLFIVLETPDGNITRYDLKAPVMQPSGKYIVNLEYNEMKPEMNLSSVRIDDWTEGWVYYGEIFDPEN